MKKRGGRLLKKSLHAVINAVFTVIILTGAAIAGLRVCGIQLYSVLTGSMEPELPVGSICLIDRRYSFSELIPGDIITFRLSDDSVVTHRAVRIIGDTVYTRGDANNAEDSSPVTEEGYIGKCILSLPKTGYIVRFIRSRIGLPLLAALIVFLIAADRCLGRA